MADTAVEQPPAGDTPAEAPPSEAPSTETPVEPPAEPPAPEPLPPVEVALDKEYECGYCFTKCPYMEDPRKLPLCDHVFCAICLDGNLNPAVDFCCPACTLKQEWRTLDDLPKVIIQSSVDHVEEERAHNPSSCQDVRDCSKSAAHYCVKCDKRFCKQFYSQVHKRYEENDLYGGSSHRVIEIHIYNRAPDRYHDMRYRCEEAEHDRKVIIKGCHKCCLVYCKKCKPETQNCKDGTKNHDMKSLTDSAETLRLNYESLLKTLSEKSSEISKQKKNTWRELYWLNDRQVEMCAEVDRITEEQIAEIRRKAEEVKTEIVKFFTDSEVKVEEYQADLDRRQAEVDELSRTTRVHLNQDHDTLRVKQFFERSARITELSSQIINPCDLKTLELQNKYRIS